MFAHFILKYVCIMCLPECEHSHTRDQSVDCMSKTGETIALLHRHASLARTIYNTGAILEEAITSALGLRKLVWQPRHASPLSNQFYSFANYPSERLGGFDKPIEAVVRAVAELGVARSADDMA
jgi:hypothetical protein